MLAVRGAVRMCPRYHIKTLLAGEENSNREVFHKLLTAMMPLMARTITAAGIAATSAVGRRGGGGGSAAAGAAGGLDDAGILEDDF